MDSPPPPRRPYDEFEIDRQKRRLIMVARPGFAGTLLSQATARLIKDDPVVASYDFILDVRNSDTGATQADLDIVLAAYRSVPRNVAPKFGCYVTTDRFFHMWVASMDELFGDRRCLTFDTMERALAFLDQHASREIEPA